MAETQQSLTGRDTERSELAALLGSGARWVSIVGPVGVGKSALARSAAAEARAARLFDVVVGDAAELPSELEGPALLLLDDADAELERIPGWLAEHPELTVLATARRAAGTPDEHVVELAPLGPEAGLALFLACARKARPGYEPSEAERNVLVELVAELDGLPLAVELCAPRLSVMGPAALLHRVRQTRVSETLDRALESAWQSLAAEEQSALAQLAVFPGSFDLEAAEAVLRADDALERVSALRARSWIASHAGDDGEVRLSLLACVRRFVRARADAALTRAAERAHAAHFAVLAGDPRRLVVERHNLDAVIASVLADRPVTRQEAEPALRVLVALYFARGEPAPAAHLALLDPVLERTRDSGADPVLVGQALIAAGAARGRAGDRARALRDLARGAQLARVLGREDLVAAAKLDLAELLLAELEPSAAEDAAKTALASFTARGDVPGEARALLTLGRATRSPAVLERAAALFDAAGEDATLARHELARLLIDAGDHAAAEPVLGRAPSPVLSAMLEHDRGHRLTPDQCRALGGDLALALGAACAAEAGELGEAHALLRAALPGLDARDRAALGALSAWLDSRVLGAPAPAKDESTFWGRCLARAAAPRTPPPPPAGALAIGAEGRWFRVPGGEMLSLERRRPLARILLALAQRPRDEPVSWRELQEAAWPGEKLVRDAGAHRVRVAVSTLRKLGLGALLVTRGDGYLLSPEQPVFLEPSHG